MRIFEKLFSEEIQKKLFLYNFLVILITLLFGIAVFILGSILLEMLVMMLLFLFQQKGQSLEMGSMAIMILVPLFVFLADLLFCSFILARNIKTRKQ